MPLVKQSLLFLYTHNFGQYPETTLRPTTLVSFLPFCR